MSFKRALALTATLGMTLALGACASEQLIGGGTTTSALPEKSASADPACGPLANQIDTLRKDGVADRVAAASQGKTPTVNMKRESLAKVAELNKANADFQSKCSTIARPASAPAVAQAAPAAVNAKAAAPVGAKAATSVAAKAAAKAAVPSATKAATAPSAPADASAAAAEKKE